MLPNVGVEMPKKGPQLLHSADPFKQSRFH
jgi:hypothetical protein